MSKLNKIANCGIAIIGGLLLSSGVVSAKDYTRKGIFDAISGSGKQMQVSSNLKSSDKFANISKKESDIESVPELAENISLILEKELVEIKTDKWFINELLRAGKGLTCKKITNPENGEIKELYYAKDFYYKEIGENGTLKKILKSSELESIESSPNCQISFYITINKF